jgi:isoquinoline 1-oxidoreductase alpha subunit
MTDLDINGKIVSVDVPAGTPLLWVLRDELGLTGTKFGCGIALCGACTVHLDGAPTRSCVTPISTAAGKKIATIEAIGGLILPAPAREGTAHVVHHARRG